MFTGIITHIGTVRAIDTSGDWKFTIAAEGFTKGLTMGASIAHSGACLTAIAWDDDSFVVQVSQETLDCTTLGSWKVGTRLNLERALKVGDELGGHFVSGHVDGIATLETIDAREESQEWWLSVPADLAPYVAHKGSVTLDGVSLTVNKVDGKRFSINLIPHTQQNTTFADRKTGDTLNFEVDLIARYLARQTEMP